MRSLTTMLFTAAFLLTATQGLQAEEPNKTETETGTTTRTETTTSTNTDTHIQRPASADPDKSILTNKNIHGGKVIDPVTLDPK